MSALCAKNIMRIISFNTCQKTSNIWAFDTWAKWSSKQQNQDLHESTQLVISGEKFVLKVRAASNKTRAQVNNTLE